MNAEKLIRMQLRTDITVKVELLRDVDSESFVFKSELETINNLLETLRYYSTDRDFAEFMDSIQALYYPALCKYLKNKS